MKCKICGEELSKSELKTIIEAQENGSQYGIEIVMCDECFEMKENNISDYDTFSDADPGL